MTISSDYLSQAELAFAAYADLTGPVSGHKVALEAAGMTSSQANLFLSTYTALSQYNASNGLSATVFADASGNKYLAIRGTDDGYDLATDVIDIKAEAGISPIAGLDPQVGPAISVLIPDRQCKVAANNNRLRITA